MLPRLIALMAGLLLPATALADEVGTNDQIPSEQPTFKIADDIAALATDPLASPDGAVPSPVLQRRMQVPPPSSVFYALPVFGFWLILRRRGRGVRL